MDATVLMWGVLFGSIGMGYFIYGKRQSHALARYTGVALIVYPYFIKDSTMLVAVGILLMFMPKLLSRFSLFD